MNHSALQVLLAKKAALDAVLSRIEVWLLIFGVIVVVGVAGESIFGVRSWWNNRKLQSIQRDIDKQREDLAREQAEQFRLDIANAELLAADAQRDLAAANARAAAANERAAKAEKATEDERLARLKIEERLAPRTFSAEQQVAKLRPFSGQQFSIATYNFDRECMVLMNTLIEVLKEAGWERPPRPATVLFGTSYIAVIAKIPPNPENHIKEAAQTFVGALIDENIEAAVLEDPDFKPTRTITILVGMKP